MLEKATSCSPSRASPITNHEFFSASAASTKKEQRHSTVRVILERGRRGRVLDAVMVAISNFMCCCGGSQTLSWKHLKIIVKERLSQPGGVIQCVQHHHHTTKRAEILFSPSKNCFVSVRLLPRRNKILFGARILLSQNREKQKREVCFDEEFRRQ